MRFYTFESWLASWSWRYWLLLVVVLAGLCVGLDAAERRGWLPAQVGRVAPVRPGR